MQLLLIRLYIYVELASKVYSKLENAGLGFKQNFMNAIWMKIGSFTVKTNMKIYFRYFFNKKCLAGFGTYLYIEHEKVFNFIQRDTKIQCENFSKAARKYVCFLWASFNIGSTIYNEKNWQN